MHRTAEQKSIGFADVFASLTIALGMAVSPLLSGAASAEEDTSPPAREQTAAYAEEYDPFDGVEKSGRIPGVERPAELKNPDRWRYIPEGRIKPGTLFDRFLVSSFMAPFVTQNEDTGTGFGVTITDIDFRAKRRQEFAGIFLSQSTEGEQDYGIVWKRWLNHIEREGGGVFQEERSFVFASVGYEKTLTKRFFGFGPGDEDANEDTETSYVDEEFEVDLGMQVSWPEPGGNWILGGGLRAEFHELAGGKVSDVPQMGCDQNTGKPRLVLTPSERCHREAFLDAEHANLGWAYWEVRYDTRDSQANAYSGWMLGASVEAALLQNGGDVGAVYSIEAKKFFPVPGLFHSGAVGQEEHPPTDTVAFGFRTQLSSGDLPFFERPTLGGNTRLRGYIDGRFRDKASWWAGVEYRLWVLPRGFPIPFTHALRVERVGFAPFYEIGSVAKDGFALVHAPIQQSFGVSIRVTLERAAPFRVDFGFSDEDSTLIARFGLPF